MRSGSVDREPQIHPSHEMGDWGSTMCEWISRFGQVRECQHCGAKDYQCGGGGSRWWDEELSDICEANATSEEIRDHYEERQLRQALAVLAGYGETTIYTEAFLVEGNWTLYFTDEGGRQRWIDEVVKLFQEQYRTPEQRAQRRIKIVLEEIP